MIDYSEHGAVLELGNLDAKRDWGFAGDYVEAMHLMLQQKTADDFVIATGITHSIRTFCEMAASHLNIDLMWTGEGMDEKGIDRKTLNPIIKINPEFFRPAEVDILRGSPAKAKALLGWEPKTQLEDLVDMMIQFETKHIF